MTSLAPGASPDLTAPDVTAPNLTALRAVADRAGLAIVSSACWPETGADREVTPLAGFIESSFSPLLAAVAGRVLNRREPGAGRISAGLGSDDSPQTPSSAGLGGDHPPETPPTAIVIVTARGDVTSATWVARAVDSGRRVLPLMFFQSVPNAVAGYLAARWHLTGPVACVSGIEAGLDAAAALIEDADADEALVLWAEVAVTGDDRDQAAAVLVTRKERP